MSRGGDEEPRITFAEALELVDEIKRLQAELEVERARVAAVEQKPDVKSQPDNIAAFEDSLMRTIARVRRYGEEAVMILLKVKQDSRSMPPAGEVDRTNLKRVLEESVRVTDLVARLWPDRYAILMPHTDEAGALTLAKRVRDCIARAQAGAGGDFVAPNFATEIRRVRRSDTAEALMSFLNRSAVQIRGSAELLDVEPRRPEHPIIARVR